jgi:hypothetical protein
MPGMSAMRGVLAEFGRQIGLDELAFDDQGIAVLEFDGRPVTLLAEEEADRLLLYAFPGLVAGDPVQVFGRLLDANFLAGEEGGAVLSLVPGSDVVALHRALPAAELDLPSLTAGLERMLADCDRWAGQLQAPSSPGNGSVPAGLVRA